jgi:hypothetical protein
MRDTFGNIGISIATNTALFTGLDLGQRIADTLSLWTLPANLIAAVIATVFGLALTAATRVLRVNEESAEWRVGNPRGPLCACGASSAERPRGWQDRLAQTNVRFLSEPSPTRKCPSPPGSRPELSNSR